MIDTEEYEKVFKEYPASDYWPQMKRIQAHGIRALNEIERLRKVILDFSLPMWNYLNSQVHTDAEEYTANAEKSLVENTPYESLMHLWEDACGYLPDPDCDDTPRNKPVWNAKRFRKAWEILRSKTEMSCVCFAEYPDKQDINTHELMDLAMKEASE